MASDPYHNFAADLRSSLASAQQLSAEYEQRRRRQGNGAGSQQGRYSDGVSDEDTALLTRLQEALDALESDMSDVRASVDMLSSRGPERFGVDARELEQRKRFVAECDQAIKRLQDTARQDQRHTSINMSNRSIHQGPRLDDADDDDEDDALAFEMEQQQQQLLKQDGALDLIGNTLTGLRKQAGTLGQEIGEQVEVIGALDSEVDSAQSKLTRAMGKMDELVRRSDDRMGGWCVWLLILVLMVLVLVAILI